jgi:hypothetical protein
LGLSRERPHPNPQKRTNEQQGGKSSSSPAHKSKPPAIDLRKNHEVYFKYDLYVKYDVVIFELKNTLARDTAVILG